MRPQTAVGCGGRGRARASRAAGARRGAPQSLDPGDFEKTKMSSHNARPCRHGGSPPPPPLGGSSLMNDAAKSSAKHARESSCGEGRAAINCW